MRNLTPGDRFVAEIVYTHNDSDGDPTFDIVVNGVNINDATVYFEAHNTEHMKILDEMLPVTEYGKLVKQQHFATPDAIEKFLS